MLTIRVNYLCTCIALNLMLFVCFNINPLEQSGFSRYWHGRLMTDD